VKKFRLELEKEVRGEMRMRRCQWYVFGLLLFFAGVSIFVIGMGYTDFSVMPSPDASAELMVVWAVATIKCSFYMCWGSVLMLLGAACFGCAALEKE